jgi:hypothetical protein
MLASLSVDLDELDLYDGIHARVRRAPPGLVYARGLLRALDLAKEAKVPLTLFVVSRDLERPGVCDALRDAIASGHTVESHSRTHPYDLVRRPSAELDSEVAGSFEDLERRLGVRPCGFRAPGYSISRRVLAAVARAGATFDSSVLPSPPYYAAKLAVLAAHALGGRRSTSIAGPPAQWLSSAEPRRIALGLGTPDGLLELPISVTRLGRLPLIGTTLGLLGPGLAPRLVAAAGPVPLLNLELHGVDFLDARDGPGLDLPELARPLDLRLHAFRAAIDYARDVGRRFVTLREAAASLAPSLPTSPCI